MPSCPTLSSITGARPRVTIVCSLAASASPSSNTDDLPHSTHSTRESLFAGSSYHRICGPAASVWPSGLIISSESSCPTSIAVIANLPGETRAASTAIKAPRREVRRCAVTDEAPHGESGEEKGGDRKHRRRLPVSSQCNSECEPACSRMQRRSSKLKPFVSSLAQSCSARPVRYCSRCRTARRRSTA